MTTQNKTKKRNRLHGLEISEISIVDRGAIGVPFMMYKRDSPKRSDRTGDLELLQRIQKGIDDLKRDNWDEYNFWRDFPTLFTYTFGGPGEFDGELVIKRKATKYGEGLPLAQTKTHKLIVTEDGSQVWQPKKRRDGQGKFR
jgi:hypothetical protein